jgi:acyl-CoA synthetase (AMP-forming)/AMP-acid ligase II
MSFTMFTMSQDKATPDARPPGPNPKWESEQRMRVIEATGLPQNVCALLDQQAEKNPDNLFLNFFDDSDSLTFSEVAEMTRKLAGGLAAAGIGRGTHVGIMVETTRIYPLTWLALGRLGAVTVPINYRYTSRELDYILRDSESSFIVISATFVPLLENIKGGSPVPANNTIVSGPDTGQYPDWQSLLDNATSGSGKTSPPPMPDDIMNIQYTSGTTGLPKGALLSHKYWLTFSRNGAAQFQDRLKRILVSQPFYYVDAQWLTLMACWTGAAAFITREMHSSKLLDWMRTYQLEYCNFPEVVARLPASDLDYMPQLVAMSCYSHRPENFTYYEQRYGGAARQGFSMTELGCVLYVPLEAEAMTGSGTVGIPVAFREVAIRDQQGLVVSDDTMGEICVRGEGIFQAYYNKPEATAESFYPEGWFRTGDLGMRNPQGWYWYLGRQKDMVRRSNENISAVEVEQVLRGVADVLEAAVVPVPDTTRGEEVKAYLKIRTDAVADEILIDQVIDFCGDNLAPFKIPRYYEFVNEFPRTPSQKIRKSELLQIKPDLTIGCWDRITQKWR